MLYTCLSCSDIPNRRQKKLDAHLVRHIRSFALLLVSSHSAYLRLTPNPIVAYVCSYALIKLLSAELKTYCPFLTVDMRTRSSLSLSWPSSSSDIRSITSEGPTSTSGAPFRLIRLSSLPYLPSGPLIRTRLLGESRLAGWLWRYS